jgi:hypothetical protein
MILKTRLTAGFLLRYVLFTIAYVTKDVSFISKLIHAQ